MKPIVLIAGLLGGVALLAASSKSSGKAVAPDQKITGVPEAPRLKAVILKPGENTPNFRIGPAMYLLDGKPLTPNDPIERFNDMGKIINDIWNLRATTLPKGANGQNTDEYSKELYWVPSWLANWKTYGDPRLKSKQEMMQGSNGVPVDEFGRSKPGNYGQADNSLWGQTLGGLLKNPLFKTVVIAGLIASGPQGAAIYGAYTMWEARGKDITAQNALLVAGRAYVVGQCGAACGVAFDFGVGVASGKSVDKAAEDALYEEMDPQQKMAFDEGKKTFREIT